MPPLQSNCESLTKSESKCNKDKRKENIRNERIKTIINPRPRDQNLCRDPRLKSKYETPDTY